MYEVFVDSPPPPLNRPLECKPMLRLPRYPFKPSTWITMTLYIFASFKDLTTTIKALLCKLMQCVSWYPFRSFHVNDNGIFVSLIQTTSDRNADTLTHISIHLSTLQPVKCTNQRSANMNKCIFKTCSAVFCAQMFRSLKPRDYAFESRRRRNFFIIISLFLKI